MTGRAAIVTGGLSGIGLAVAQALAGSGARVAVGGRRAADRATAEEVREAIGPGCLVATLDVADQASVDAFVAAAREAHGPAAILVNAAGITLHHRIKGHSDADWQAVIDTNLTGAFRMIRACLPGMTAAGWGRIVNIASTAAHVGAATHPAYCASKAGLVGLTRAVAEEGGPRGVTCASVSPGWVETDMLRASARKMAARSGRTVEEI